MKKSHKHDWTRWNQLPAGDIRWCKDPKCPSVEKRASSCPKENEKMTRVIIEFPNEVTAESFLGWFCDGGGEYQFMVAEDECYAEREGRNPINEFTYERCFPAWGYKPKVHGPDRTIVAHQGEREKP